MSIPHVSVFGTAASSWLCRAQVTIFFLTRKIRTYCVSLAGGCFSFSDADVVETRIIAKSDAGWSVELLWGKKQNLDASFSVPKDIVTLYIRWKP